MPRVLLVEPDKTLASAIQKYLEKHLFEVELAYDAQTAVSSADQNTPDLIVLELAMPKNNGLAFLQEFRSYTDWIDIPILVYSRISSEETGLRQEEWLKQGVAGYLYKPTSSLASLVNNINNLLTDD
jgi:two-component system, OmpR family, response regulator